MSTTQTDTLQNNFEPLSQKAKPARKSLGTRLFFGSMFFIIFFGWFRHDDFYLSAENGAGYYLGIIGGVCMLILLLYPLRKKIKRLRDFGSMKHWFKIHMALGIIGPTLILYHANFSLGSVNSNVALFSMIIVAVSGLIGRFIYTHIHRGLYGEKLTLSELKTELEQSRQHIDKQFISIPQIQEQLHRLEEMANTRRNFFLQIMYIPYMTVNIYFRRKIIKRILKKDLKNNKEQLSTKHIDSLKLSLQTIYSYLETTRRLSQLMTYERLFSLWHILHLPLFIMLIITGVIHVFAVHIY